MAAPERAATTLEQLWPGLRPAERPERTRPASLDEAQPSTALDPLRAGVRFLAVGMVALVVGFGVADVRRRRVVARVTTRR